MTIIEAEECWSMDLPEFDLMVPVNSGDPSTTQDGTVITGVLEEDNSSSKVLQQWRNSSSPTLEMEDIEDIMQIDSHLGDDLLDEKIFLNDPCCLSPTSALDDLAFSSTALDEKDLNLFSYFANENDDFSSDFDISASMNPDIPVPPPSMPLKPKTVAPPMPSKGNLSAKPSKKSTNKNSNATKARATSAKVKSNPKQKKLATSKRVVPFLAPSTAKSSSPVKSISSTSPAHVKKTPKLRIKITAKPSGLSTKIPASPKTPVSSHLKSTTAAASNAKPNSTGPAALSTNKTQKSKTQSTSKTVSHYHHRSYSPPPGHYHHYQYHPHYPYATTPPHYPYPPPHHYYHPSPHHASAPAPNSRTHVTSSSTTSPSRAPAATNCSSKKGQVSVPRNGSKTAKEDALGSPVTATKSAVAPSTTSSKSVTPNPVGSKNNVVIPKAGTSSSGSPKSSSAKSFAPVPVPANSVTPLTIPKHVTPITTPNLSPTSSPKGTPTKKAVGASAKARGALSKVATKSAGKASPKSAGKTSAKATIRAPPMDAHYHRTLQKLSDSMHRSQETRKALRMQTDKTAGYERTEDVTKVLSKIEDSTHQLRHYWHYSHHHYYHPYPPVTTSSSTENLDKAKTDDEKSATGAQKNTEGATIKKDPKTMPRQDKATEPELTPTAVLSKAASTVALKHPAPQSSSIGRSSKHSSSAAKSSSPAGSVMTQSSGKVAQIVYSSIKASTGPATSIETKTYKAAAPFPGKKAQGVSPANSTKASGVTKSSSVEMTTQAAHAAVFAASGEARSGPSVATKPVATTPAAERTAVLTLPASYKGQPAPPATSPAKAAETSSVSRASSGATNTYGLRSKTLNKGQRNSQTGARTSKPVVYRNVPMTTVAITASAQPKSMALVGNSKKQRTASVVTPCPVPTPKASRVHTNRHEAPSTQGDNVCAAPASKTTQAPNASKDTCSPTAVTTATSKAGAAQSAPSCAACC